MVNMALRKESYKYRFPHVHVYMYVYVLHVQNPFIDILLNGCSFTHMYIRVHVHVMYMYMMT